MDSHKQNLLYFAYGEHMNEQEFTNHLPHARMVGMSRLPGFRLSFVGRDGNARAAIEPAPGASVPGRVWSLFASDVDVLDRFADAPHFARREIHTIEISGMKLPALVYVTVSGQPRGRPGFVTYDLMREAYATAGEDVDLLRAYAMRSMP